MLCKISFAFLGDTERLIIEKLMSKLISVCMNSMNSLSFLKIVFNSLGLFRIFLDIW